MTNHTVETVDNRFSHQKHLNKRITTVKQAESSTKHRARGTILKKSYGLRHPNQRRGLPTATVICTGKKLNPLEEAETDTSLIRITRPSYGRGRSATSSPGTSPVHQWTSEDSPWLTLNANAISGQPISIGISALALNWKLQKIYPVRTRVTGTDLRRSKNLTMINPVV